MKNCLTIVLLMAFALTGCSGMRPQGNDHQSLVDQLADCGRGYAPPGAVKAQIKLKAMGTNAFPVLIRNVNDKRAACGCFQRETIHRTTVGEACLDIISMQVEAHSYCKAGPAYLTRENIADWWEQNQGKSIPELQEDALRWTISQIEIQPEFAWLRDNALEKMKLSLHEMKTKKASSRQSERTR